MTVTDVDAMSSSILDLSVSRGTAADTSSGSGSRAASRRSPFTPRRQDSVTAEFRVPGRDVDHDDGQATSSDFAVDDELHAADTADDKEATISSHAISGSSSDVSDDVMSRDIADHQQQLRHRPRDRSQAYQYLDYQAAAAAAAAHFLVPFPFPSPTAAATGSAPMTSSVPPLNFYPLSFPAMPPPPEAGIHFRPEGAAASAGTSCHASGAARSSADLGVKVKDDDCVTSPAAGHAVDPTYAERRRKNNEAARRSRDARRMKERETCLRAALLQQENVRLRAEMTVLKTEIARLHCLLYDKM